MIWDTPKDIAINAINSTDDSYKISRNITEDTFYQSIQANGQLEPVILLQDKDLIAISGLNRINILRQVAKTTVKAVIVDRLDLGLYLEYMQLKNFRNEIGPLGKIKLLRLLEYKLHMPAERVHDIATRYFSIPRKVVLKKDALLETLPQEIYDYIDYKNINYNIILMLASLPESILHSIAEWLQYVSFKVNIFREIVELNAEIIRKDPDMEKNIQKISIPHLENPRDMELHIYNKLYELRNPEYTHYKKQADSIIQKCNAQGVKIKFPEFFEGNSFDMTVTISKKNSGDDLLRRLHAISQEDVEKLISLL